MIISELALHATETITQVLFSEKLTKTEKKIYTKGQRNN